MSLADKALINNINNALQGLLNGVVEEEFLLDSLDKYNLDNFPELKTTFTLLRKVVSAHHPGAICPFNKPVRRIEFSGSLGVENLIQSESDDSESDSYHLDNSIFKALYENNPFAMFVIDSIDYSFISMNDAAFTFFEMGPDLFHQRRLTEFLNCEGLTQLNAVLLTEGEVKNWVADFTFPDEIVKWGVINVKKIDYLGIDSLLFGISEITAEKMVEVQTIQKNKLLELAFDNIDQGIVILDKNQNVVLANDSFNESVNPSKLNDLTKMSIVDVLDELYIQNKIDAHTKKNAYELAINNQKKRDEITLKNGDVFEVIINPLPDKAKVITLSNITEQVSLSNKFKNSEERFRKIFWSIPYPLVISDLHSTVIYSYNKAAGILFDLTESDLNVFKLIDLYVNADDRTFIKQEIMLNGYSADYRVRMYGRDKSIKWVRLNTVRYSYENIPSLLTGVLDITSQVMFENKLEETKGLMSEVLEQTPNAMLLVSNPDLKIQYVNKALFEYLDIRSDANLLGQYFSELDMRFTVYNAEGEVAFTPDVPVDGFYRASELPSREFKIVYNSGVEKWASIGVKKILDKQSKIIAFLVVVSDITELKLVNEKMWGNQAELSELNATKDKLFSIISHDLKNPFHIILGISDLLRNEYDSLSKAEIKHFVSSLSDVSSNAYRLLENLLQWSRLQRGKLSSEPTEINLYTMTDSVLQLNSGSAERKGINLLNMIDYNHNVFVAAEIIETIMRNLIGNAVKYTNSGGEVKVSAIEEESFTTIYVSDSGIGIKEEDLNKIFNSNIYFTTKGTGSEKGTGLGLALVKEFVEIIDGVLRVESIVGVGTTFSFTVPTKPKLKNNLF